MARTRHKMKASVLEALQAEFDEDVAHEAARIMRQHFGQSYSDLSVEKQREWDGVLDILYVNLT